MHQRVLSMGECLCQVAEFDLQAGHESTDGHLEAIAQQHEERSLWGATLHDLVQSCEEGSHPELISGQSICLGLQLLYSLSQSVLDVHQR